MLPEVTQRGKKPFRMVSLLNKVMRCAMIGSLSDLSLTFLIRITNQHDPCRCPGDHHQSGGARDDIAGTNRYGQCASNREFRLSYFSARAVVHHVSPAVREQLRIGVSATIHLSMSQQATLNIPLEAVHVASGKRQVQREDGSWQTVERRQRPLKSVTITGGPIIW